MELLPSAQLALDTLLHRPTEGIPAFWVNVMEHAHMERLAGVAPGEYRRHPEEVYIACQRAAGVCCLDQYIPDNPLTMGAHGYEGAARGATTGAEEIVCDGIVIDSPGGRSRAPGAIRVPAAAAGGGRALTRRRGSGKSWPKRR